MDSEKSGPTQGHEEQCAAFAQELLDLVTEQARKRQASELRWLEDTSQYFGQFSRRREESVFAESEEPEPDDLFMNQTRPKVKVMRARLIDILFPNDEANWSLSPTPVPELDFDMDPDEGSPPPQPTGPPEEGMPFQQQPEGGLTEPPGSPLEAAEQQEAADAASQQAAQARAVREEGRRRAEAMKRLVADQLEECDYATIGARVIDQAVLLGTGVCKGPYPDWRERTKWERYEDKWTEKKEESVRPAFTWVDLWNFYPDMEATSPADMEYAFELHRMNRAQMRKLARQPDFNGKAIEQILKARKSAYEDVGSEAPDQQFHEHLHWLRTLNGHDIDSGMDSRFSVFEYHGPVAYKNLEALCHGTGQKDLLSAFENEDDPMATVDGVVWFCEGRILKFGASAMESSDLPYSLFRFDVDTNGLLGIGLPTVLRHPQRSTNRNWHLQGENAKLAGVPMYEIDRDVLQPADNRWEIKPGKIWYRNGLSENPGILPVQIAGSSRELGEMIDRSQKACDDETNLPLVVQGEQGTYANQTAHGMSLLVNAVNIVFRNAARNFDQDFTIPNIKRLYRFNMLHSEHESVKGDMQVEARGSSVLLVREVQAQNLLMVLNLGATNPLLTEIIRVPALLRRLFQALQIARDEAVLTDKEIAEIERQKAEQPPQIPPDVEARMISDERKAEVDLHKAEMERDIKLMEIASRERISVEAAAAQLAAARETIASKERLSAAEFAVKKRMGTGI